jgi:hypothetical protein
MTNMVGAHGLPPEIIEYPLLLKWWPPSMAVAFLAFGGDVRLLRSRSTESLWEHGPLSRMLGVQDEFADTVRAAVTRLERELKSGTVAARGNLQRAYWIAGSNPSRGRPAYQDIDPADWGNLIPEGPPGSGLSVHLDEIEFDVLGKDGRPHLWNWEVRRADVLRLPDNDSENAARIAAVRNSLTEVPFRIANILRELESMRVSPPHQKQERVAHIRAAYRDRYRAGTGIRTVEMTLKTLRDSQFTSAWL